MLTARLDDDNIELTWQSTTLNNKKKLQITNKQRFKKRKLARNG